MNKTVHALTVKNFVPTISTLLLGDSYWKFKDIAGRMKLALHSVSYTYRFTIMKLAQE